MAVADKIAVVCGHVLRDERPVRLVVHHSDDDWQFACGDYDTQKMLPTPARSTSDTSWIASQNWPPALT